MNMRRILDIWVRSGTGAGSSSGHPADESPWTISSPNIFPRLTSVPCTLMLERHRVVEVERERPLILL